MENYAKLIHKSNITYLPTKLPVQFYGLPDGKVYVIFARFYEIKFKRSDLEYVLAEHQEFSYNYSEEKIIPHFLVNKKVPVYNETVDKPDPKITVLKVSRDFHSFADAFAHLNKKAKVLLNKKPEKIKIIPKDKNQGRLSIA